MANIGHYHGDEMRQMVCCIKNMLVFFSASNHADGLHLSRKESDLIDAERHCFF